MSDREPFQTARDAGLKARHETRLARAQEVECSCYKLLRGAGGEVRHHPTCPNQAAPDQTETREARAIRKQVAEEIAVAIEGMNINSGRERQVALGAATIAREIGSKEAGE